tara:strand:+ start:108 stop:1727 length:1620 start_codon:yes stop_codon:yes gene_type:complete
MGVKVIFATFQATTISCLIVGFLMMFFRESDLPRSVLPIFWFITNIFIITIRFLFQGILYSWDTKIKSRKPTIIYGAGNAGVQLVENLKKSSDYAPIAFIDDDIRKQGTILNFLQVYEFDFIQELIKKKNAKVLLLAIPSLNVQKRKRLLTRLASFPIEVSVLPSLENIIDGKVSIENIKNVDVVDILGRSSVLPKKDLLKQNIQSKNILITGAGGSIGSELSRQIINLEPNKVVLLDNSEYNLYSIKLELEAISQKIDIIPALCTVTNFNQLKNIIINNEVDTIFHAAAYKHVPLVELNPIAGIYNNVIGTYNLAKIANDLGLERMVLISTDKAVRPTNVMGASKRMSELVLQAYSEKSVCCFSMVRFGNVLDSAGSVVPLFRKQIKNGGPVTVTHKDITRYFMSIPEASQLVIQAASMAKGGDVFVLDMGEPVKIVDLAYKMIHLSGFTPIDKENKDGDIMIKYTGLRPGEKLYEELLIGDNVVSSEHPMIMRAIENKISMNDLTECIRIIKDGRDRQDVGIIKKLLLKYVDGYVSN